jgi:hypothetical protein
MDSDSPTKEDKYNEEDISYEEEQLQQILLQESEKQKIAMDRELREAQEKEYQECVDKDTPTCEEQKSFDEPSLDEMRQVRLARFSIKTIKE